jgi:hypothetical protein
VFFLIFRACTPEFKTPTPQRRRVEVAIRSREHDGGDQRCTGPRGAMAIRAFVFAATWFVTGAMAAHLPRQSAHTLGA